MAVMVSRSASEIDTQHTLPLFGCFSALFIVLPGATALRTYAVQWHVDNVLRRNK